MPSHNSALSSFPVPKKHPNMVPIIIVPGWQDSPPGHWQSLWAAQLPGAVRVQQDDWIAPSRKAWIASISRTVLEQDRPVVIAAHSLGCIAIAHLPPDVAARIQGALLVAPADPERRGVLADFAPVPYQKLPYHNIVVASNTDPFCPVRTAGAYARAWGSEFVRLQNAGHINLDAGFGPWPLGLALLQSLLIEAESPQAEAPVAA
jgi:predicted alpha/beta hydrolase family esterase